MMRKCQVRFLGGRDAATQSLLPGNYALREIKDWCDSRKCLIDRCSLEKEYIIPAKAKFPKEINQLNNWPKAKKEFAKIGEVPSQVIQQGIKQLYRGWEYFQERGFGFPRFKNNGQFKFLLFPQFKDNQLWGAIFGFNETLYLPECL